MSSLAVQSLLDEKPLGQGQDCQDSPPSSTGQTTLLLARSVMIAARASVVEELVYNEELLVRVAQEFLGSASEGSSEMWARVMADFVVSWVLPEGGGEEEESQFSLKPSSISSDNRAAQVLQTLAAFVFIHISGDSENNLLLPTVTGQHSTNARKYSIALLMLELAARLQGLMLHGFQTWFASALHGIGDPSSQVRQCCLSAFKLLVPLAPIGRAMNLLEPSSSGENAADSRRSFTRGIPASEGGRISSLLETLFPASGLQPPRIDRSRAEIDATIIEALKKSTHLFGEGLAASIHSHPNNITHMKNSIAHACLRGYQLDGVTWLTQLRRCGLSGVLADEM